MRRTPAGIFGIRSQKGNFFRKSQKTIDFRQSIRYNSIKESVRPAENAGAARNKIEIYELIRRINIWHYR